MRYALYDLISRVNNDGEGKENKWYGYQFVVIAGTGVVKLKIPHKMAFLGFSTRLRADKLLSSCTAYRSYSTRVCEGWKRV